MKILNALKYLTLILLFVSCGNKNKTKETEVQNAVAKAGDDQLGKDEFSNQLEGFAGLKDSLTFANRAIETWAKEALFYQEANSKLDESEIQIEEQVQSYRKELVNYIYQTKIIEANLDTVMDNEEISNYYNLHRDNFILKENIVKVNYIKIPLKAKAIDKVKKLLFSNVPNDLNQLKSLCAQFAENFFLNDSTWLFMDEIKREIPALRDQPDFSLVAGRMVQYADDNYFYYLRIKEVKVKNALSPINFEKQNIKKFIINNRKTALINQYKQLLLEKAKADKRFVVY